MVEHPRGDTGEPTPVTADGADGRHGSLQWVLLGMPFFAYLWWRSGWRVALTPLLVAVPLILVGRLIPEQMRRNPRVWTAYEAAVIVVAVVAAVLVFT